METATWPQPADIRPASTTGYDIDARTVVKDGYAFGVSISDDGDATPGEYGVGDGSAYTPEAVAGWHSGEWQFVVVRCRLLMIHVDIVYYLGAVEYGTLSPDLEITIERIIADHVPDMISVCLDRLAALGRRLAAGETR
ncbi:MAG: hypothetical protein ABW022_20215 [Actinoplanes sp.]